jgi:hypothetical protein
VRQLDELAGRVLHALGPRHAPAVVQAHRVADAHATPALAHLLLVHLGRQALGGDLALAGEAHGQQDADVQLHRRLVARAGVLPQHLGAAVQLAAVVAAQGVGQARVGGPAGQEGGLGGAGLACGRGGRRGGRLRRAGRVGRGDGLVRSGRVGHLVRSGWHRFGRGSRPRALAAAPGPWLLCFW